MRSVTAIIMSRHPVPAKTKARVPEDVQVLNFISEFVDFNAYRRSWLMAVSQVTTEWFFFLDHDDLLPPGFSEMLDRIIASAGDAALAYTNELIINDAGIKVESIKGPYSPEAFINDADLLHHLVLCRTEVAKRAMTVLAEGHRLPEPMLYFQMAKEGAAWHDEIAYHWHRSAGGMSRWPGALAARVAAMTWCAKNLALESPPKPPPADSSPDQLVAAVETPPAPADSAGEAPFVPDAPSKRRTRNLTKG